MTRSDSTRSAGRDAQHPSGSSATQRRTGLRRALGVAVPTALVAGLLPLAAGPVAAAITVQPEQTWETGIVTSVADGDTITVEVQSAADPGFIAPPASLDPLVPSARSYCTDRINPDGSMPADDLTLDGCRVRLIGIQAPEKAGAQGGSALQQCLASAATTALKNVLPTGTVVQLRSISSRSREDEYSGGRLARTVYKQDASGQWVDVGTSVMASGTAMWFPFHVGDAEKPEYVHNQTYRRLVDEAAAAGRGLWSANLCGASVPAVVRTWVVSDPIGDDANAEHMVVFNDSDAALDVSGWTVRESSLFTYTLPPGIVIGPHDYVRIFAGPGLNGTPTARDLHMNGPAQVFTNFDSTAGYFHGDGAYVFDAQAGYAYGNLRAWFHYPCDTKCGSDPLTGRLQIGLVSYDPAGTDTADAEFVDVTNVSPWPIALGGYALTRQGGQIPFPPNAVLAAGATLRVSMGIGVDDASRIHLGRTTSLLANAGDVVAVANLDGAVIDCRAWGSMSCAGMPVSGALQTPTTAAPVAAPVAVAPSTKPAAPQAVTASVSKRRIVVRWAAPAANGSAAVTKYRVRVYKQVGAKKKLKYRATCTAKAKKLTCRTKKLARKTTYVVKAQARNKKGYGPYAAPVTIRIK